MYHLGLKIAYLMAPESLEVIWIFNNVRGGEESTLDHTSKVSQVEQIMRLSRGRQQVCHGVLVHFQSTANQQFADSEIFFGKTPETKVINGTSLKSTHSPLVTLYQKLKTNQSFFLN